MQSTKSGYHTLHARSTEFDHLLGVRAFAQYCEIVDEHSLHLLRLEEDHQTLFLGNKDLDICLRFKRDQDERSVCLTLTGIYHYPETFYKDPDELEEDLIRHRSFLRLSRTAIEWDERSVCIELYDLTKMREDSYIELISEGKI